MKSLQMFAYSLHKVETREKGIATTTDLDTPIVADIASSLATYGRPMYVSNGEGWGC